MTIQWINHELRITTGKSLYKYHKEMTYKQAYEAYALHNSICKQCINAEKSKTRFQDKCDIGFAMWERYLITRTKEENRYIPIKE
jgi:hypothetical protein